MPPEPPRNGPRALAAYLSASAGAAAGAARLDPAQAPVWRAALSHRAHVALARLAQYDRAAAQTAVARAGLAQLAEAIRGVEAYRETPPVRRPPDPPTLWRDGTARLLDFGSEAPDAPPVLAIPSLVNRAHVLDLTRARSLMRGLRARGLRPMLLDWGGLGLEERGFDLADYVTRRIGPALRSAHRATGRRVALLGHCMGGALALAAAQLGERETARIALMAAPWDASQLLPPEPLRPKRRDLEQLIGACRAVFGGVPPDVLDLLFFARDPLQALRKFPAFARMSRQSARGRLFVAVEDWLNDGVRLAAPAARDVFVAWALDNAPMRGRWRVGGVPIRPERLLTPALIVASRADTIAPYDSALTLRDALPNADRIEPSAGHVGMIVGRRAETELWDPLADWLRG